VKRKKVKVRTKVCEDVTRNENEVEKNVEHWRGAMVPMNQPPEYWAWQASLYL